MATIESTQRASDLQKALAQIFKNQGKKSINEQLSTFKPIRETYGAGNITGKRAALLAMRATSIGKSCSVYAMMERCFQIIREEKYVSPQQVGRRGAAVGFVCMIEECFYQWVGQNPGFEAYMARRIDSQIAASNAAAIDVA